MKVTSVVLTLSAIVALAQVTALPLPPQEPGLIPLSKRQNIGLISGKDNNLIGLLEGNESFQDGNKSTTQSHSVGSGNDRVGDLVQQDGDLIAENTILNDVLANVL